VFVLPTTSFASHHIMRVNIDVESAGWWQKFLDLFHGKNKGK